jgi:hypothetical protein
MRKSTGSLRFSWYVHENNSNLESVIIVGFCNTVTSSIYVLFVVRKISPHYLKKTMEYHKLSVFEVINYCLRRSLALWDRREMKCNNGLRTRSGISSIKAGSSKNLIKPKYARFVVRKYVSELTWHILASSQNQD